MIVKRLLVIGAMFDVVEISRVAKSCGIHVINFRNGFHAVPNPHADEIREMDIFDREAVLTAARELKPDGILANADLYMPVAVFVGRALGLTVNSPEAVDIMRSKFRFRESVRACGCFAPRCVRVDAPEELLEKLSALTYPVILKPICGNGSFGARRFDRYEPEAMVRTFQRCLRFPGCRAIIAEEFVEPQSRITLEAEVFLHRGRFVWGGTIGCLRQRTNPLFSEANTLPACLEEDVVRRFRSTAEKALAATGASYGEFNVEGFLTQTGEMFIIEINPRQGGGLLPWASWRHNGIDLSRLLVTTAVGDDRYFEQILVRPPENHPILLYTLFADRAGTYVGIIEKAGFPGRKIRADSRVGIGMAVKPPVKYTDKLVTLYYEFDRVDDMLKARDHLNDWVRPVIVPRRWYHRFALYRLLKWGCR